MEGLCCCVEAERSFDGNGIRSRFREGMEHVEDGTRRGWNTSGKLLCYDESRARREFSEAA